MSIPSTQAVIYYEENGSPDVLKYSTTYPVPTISSTEILVKNIYTGVNYIETYFRKGIYPCTFPYIPGREAVGEVVQIGSDVTNYSIGDKIAYLGTANFAQYTKLNSTSVSIINLGTQPSDDQLQLYAAALLQGLTALTFINEAYDVQEGDYILVTAAAGGVGLILNQLLSKVKHAHVIAVASTDEKLQLAKENGAEYLLNSSKLSYKEIGDRIMEITSGAGVAGIFDSIGKDSFEMDLAVIKRKGTIISYGNASGPVDPLLINRLSPKNVKVARPQLFGYVAEKSEFEYYTTQLFKLIDDGTLSIRIHHVYDLQEYPQATVAMENRSTTGKLLLRIPPKL